MKIKFIIRYCILLLVLTLAFPSCIDNDYDWDKIDKNGVLKIPPVPLGTYESVNLASLPNIPPHPSGGIPINMSITKYYTIKNIFADDAVDDFFFDGADDAEIVAKTDIQLSVTNAKVKIDFDILDSEEAKLSNISIPSIELINAKNQTTSIKIPAQSMKHMQNAHHLMLSITISAESVWLGNEDYMQLKDIILKTGGLHVEL